MGSPKQPEQSGLQHYNPHADAPEVVTSAKPEVRTSHDLPEAVPSHGEGVKTVQAYYADEPEQYDGHYSVPPKYEHHEDYAAVAAQDKRKKRKKMFIWIGVAVLVVIIIIAAVVGGVVGSKAAHSDSSTSTSSGASTSNSTSNTTQTPPDSLKVISYGGFALTETNNGNNRWAYAQLASGSVIEIPWANGSWAYDKQVVVTTNANAGASLAAVAYSLNGTDYRTVAFVTIEGKVFTTTTTHDNLWSNEAQASTLGDATSNSGAALAICADMDVLVGLRLYYGSNKGLNIREVGLDMSKRNQKWAPYANFTDAAWDSGVACSINQGLNHVYYHNNTQIQQWVWNYGANDGWNKRANSPASLPTSDHTRVAVATDGNGTDYVFYQISNLTVVRTTFSGTNNVFNNPVGYQVAGTTSEFAAIYLDSSSQTYMDFAPVNGGGLTYAITDASGKAGNTGVLAYWQR